MTLLSKSRLYHGPLQVRKSLIHGYGVFATRDIASGELIEECHTLSPIERDPGLIDYYFMKQEGLSVLPLGFGSIYNHSDSPNAGYEYDADQGIMIFTALRPIRAGEEIYCYYGVNWFSSRDLPVKKPSLLRQFSKSALCRGLIVSIALLGFVECWDRGWGVPMLDNPFSLGMFTSAASGHS